MDTEKERATGIGHAFGVRVDGAAPRGLWPPAGGRLCRRVVKEKVLRIDRPAAGGFLSLTAFQAEGGGIALRAMSIKSALRIHLSVSYGMIGILVISHLRWHFLERSEAGLFSPACRAVVWFSPPKAV